MSQPVTKEEEKKIIEALNKGKSINKVAKELKRSSATISKYARKNNINIEYVVSKKAHEANSYYSKVNRMNLLRKGFEKAEELLTNAVEYRDFKDWSMAVAILIDKQRLEEGEPTEISRSNVNSQNSHTFSREKLRELLNDTE
jgi:IS30 family transposase